MATYALIHGAASDSWYWHLVAPELRTRGHHVVAVDLPCDDDAAGFPEYADTVIDAVGGRADLVLVAQSMAGFTAALVCGRVPVKLLVLVAAMVPRPGETGAEWWENTGHQRAQRAAARREGRSPDEGQDLHELFFHDLPPELAEEALKHGRNQSSTPFDRPWPLEHWPDVPTRFLLCRHDRLFPAEFLRRVVWDRLAVVADEMDGGHLPALSRPQELVERLEAYRAEAAIR
jgi:pimeloyl-ACP methyl ester carboxylesterase